MTLLIGHIAGAERQVVGGMSVAEGGGGVPGCALPSVAAACAGCPVDAVVERRGCEAGALRQDAAADGAADEAVMGVGA